MSSDGSEIWFERMSICDRNCSSVTICVFGSDDEAALLAGGVTCAVDMDAGGNDFGLGLRKWPCLTLSPSDGLVKSASCRS